ncbi:hypothetical protein, partial [Cloacibacillus porcorum]
VKLFLVFCIVSLTLFLSLPHTGDTYLADAEDFIFEEASVFSDSSQDEQYYRLRKAKLPSVRRNSISSGTEEPFSQTYKINVNTTVSVTTGNFLSYRRFTGALFSVPLTGSFYRS